MLRPFRAPPAGAKYAIRRSGTEAATAGAEAAAAGAGAEAGSNRSQRRADPDPLGAARARPGEQDGNYTVLRDLGSPDFQANSAARLAEIFAQQRRDNIDLSEWR